MDPSDDTNKFVSVGCQTDPNLIDKLIDGNHVKKQLDDVDLYQEYVRSAQCAQFWPLDKNPIRSLVPSMVKVDLPEQYLKNESLMFDLVQAISNNSKLVNLLAKYIHHIVPNVIISKRIDLIPLITCTIRVCRDTSEQERLISLLFNLIKRPNEEQRRMILSGIIVVLQVSPHQSSSLLMPNLWDHVNDKFPERRILLAESCAALAHYVRPVMRTNLILSILIQLLKDKNAAVRSASCKSFACLLTLIMDRNDEVFDACLSATEDIIQDVLQQTPVNFCEHRFELEQMRYCALETVYPLLCMWAVKLNRFKVEIAEFYLSKAEKYFSNMLNQPTQAPTFTDSILSDPAKAAAAAIARRRSVFFEKKYAGGVNNINDQSGFLAPRRQSSYVGNQPPPDSNANSAMLTTQRAISAYLKMLNYLVPFVFSDAVHSCAWLSKSNLPNQCRQPKFSNQLLDPKLIIDESAIVAFYDQLEHEHESLDWLSNAFLPRFFDIMAKFFTSTNCTTEVVKDYLLSLSSSARQLCLLFGKHLTRTKIQPFIKQYITSHNAPALYSIYIASLTVDEPIEQRELEEIVSSIRQNLSLPNITRNDVEILALSIKIIASNSEQIHSPSTRQKFLTYILDALISYSNQNIKSIGNATNSSSNTSSKADQQHQTQTKEYMLIIFRHILTCLIQPEERPPDWAHILVTKFLPSLISLANDSGDIYVCTYARLMCAQLVETFDTYLNSPKLTKQIADSMLPALESLKSLTEQIKASNLKRQIECLSHDLTEKFFNDENNNVVISQS